MARLLLVEDDERISEPLRVALAGEGFEIEAVTTGEDALDSLRRTLPDLVLLDLTPKEFDLLVLLVREAGRTVRRERIMREVWDEHWWGPTRTLDNHVSSLRRKLGDSADEPHRIVTIRGVGFRFEG